MSKDMRSTASRRSCRLGEGDGEVADGEEGSSAHLNVFRGSKASRTASPTKISSDSISEMTTKPVRPSQGALRLSLPCAQQFAERGRAGRQAEAEEVERGQRGDRAVEDERQEGQRRHHGVGQQVAEHDGAVGDAERARRVDVFEVARRAGTRRAPRRRSATQENSSIMPSRTKKPGGRTADDDQQQVERPGSPSRSR